MTNLVMSNRLLIGIVVLTTLFLMVVVAVMTPPPRSLPVSAPVARHLPERREPVALVEQENKSGLSKANYLRISEGMTYREVVAVLGKPGEEMSRSDIAGFTTVMYGWKRWNGANMNAIFQNDALVTKAQFGLD